MDRRIFGYGELVTADTTKTGTLDDKLNLVFDDVEASANERALDHHPYGILTGLEVVANAPANLTVKVNAGVAGDQAGQRIAVPSQQSIDPLTAYGGGSIALPGLGNEKYVSVFLKAKRLEQDTAQDDNSVQYYQSSLEHFEIRVRAGSEAASGTATPPALQGAEILLADIKLTPGMTTIQTSDIQLTSRRQDAYALSPSATTPKTIRYGNVKSVVTDLLSWINDILNGDLTLDTLGITHSNGSEKFAGAVNPPSDGDLRTWLRTLVTMLGKTTSTVGADLIGNSSLGNWADSSAAGNAGGLGVQVRNAIAALAASTGTAKIGGAAVSQSPTSLSAADLATQLGALLTAINARARKASAETISAAWNFTTAPTIAFSPTGNIAATDVAAAIAELDTEKAALAGATFTGEVKVPRVAVTIQRIGVIAANTQILDTVGVVDCRAPSTNAQYNLALPEPASGGTQVLYIKFRGGHVGAGRIVYLTNTANLSTSNPTDYYAYWDASSISTSSAGCIMFWDDTIPTRWRMIASWNMTGDTGGGSLAD